MEGTLLVAANGVAKRNQAAIPRGIPPIDRRGARGVDLVGIDNDTLRTAETRMSAGRAKVSRGLVHLCDTGRALVRHHKTRLVLARSTTKVKEMFSGLDRRLDRTYGE